MVTLFLEQNFLRTPHCCIRLVCSLLAEASDLVGKRPAWSQSSHMVWWFKIEYHCCPGTFLWVPQSVPYLSLGGHIPNKNPKTSSTLPGGMDSL